MDTTQRDAWQEEIAILQEALIGVDGALLLEFDVPRVGSRIDAVVLTESVVLVLEFKVGAKTILDADINQVWDYALDLKNFHKASHHHAIVPILISTGAQRQPLHWTSPADDKVYRPVATTAVQLQEAIQHFRSTVQGQPIDAVAWVRSPYHPTPTIIQAAQALYSRHSVEAIASSEAGENLTVTSAVVERIIDESRASKTKSIVFVTGVPGAGKTLVGLNIATRHRDKSDQVHAVYLSGNAPLVKVLSHALARDEIARSAEKKKPRKGAVLSKIKAFIQNVHHFRDEGLNDSGAPPDHVVIFDEAQRAWNRQMTADFMKRKKGRPDFDKSEPAFLLSYLDRHRDWAAVICLVGGGQEINRGEAGIAEWLHAIKGEFPHWRVHISPNLTDEEYGATSMVSGMAPLVPVEQHQSLHLSVSLRSFRAEHISSFIKALLDVDREAARTILARVQTSYPMALTRDLGIAKGWIRRKARGTERFGLIASSGAQRLKPHAIDVRHEVDPVQWFLNEPDDTRSSYYMEDPATEFQVQGLELDWTCVTWDADLRFDGTGWSHHSFKASRWENVNKQDRQRYLRNAYRVLLTRARQGMVIFVPPGSNDDSTRDPSFYDRTYEYLQSIGIPEVP